MNVFLFFFFSFSFGFRIEFAVHSFRIGGFRFNQNKILIITFDAETAQLLCRKRFVFFFLFVLLLSNMDTQRLISKPRKIVSHHAVFVLQLTKYGCQWGLERWPKMENEQQKWYSSFGFVEIQKMKIKKKRTRIETKRSRTRKYLMSIKKWSKNATFQIPIYECNDILTCLILLSTMYCHIQNVWSLFFFLLLIFAILHTAWRIFYESENWIDQEQDNRTIETWHGNQKWLNIILTRFDNMNTEYAEHWNAVTLKIHIKMAWWWWLIMQLNRAILYYISFPSSHSYRHHLSTHCDALNS